MIERLVNGTVSSLVTTTSIPHFRYLLIRWIVFCHIALSIVEHEAFRALVIFLCPLLEDWLVKSHNTIRRWIISEYRRQRRTLQAKIHKSNGMVHISFDLWTSRAFRGLLAIVAHWLDEKQEMQVCLLSLKRVPGSHTGENLAEALSRSLVEWGLVDRIGFFTADNDPTNDKAIRLLLQQLRPDIANSDKGRRIRCIGHIINLVMKAFLFGEDADSFEIEVGGAVHLGRHKSILKAWRKRGPLGKLHNTLIHIRGSSKRREAFLASGVVGDEVQNGKLEVVELRLQTYRFISYLLI